MDQTYWTNRYVEKQVGWELKGVHPKLLEFMNFLTCEKTPKKFFLPLCGKSKDIPYLLSLGHSVFGIEYVAQAIEEFAVENSIDLKFVEETSTYETSDGKLIIYRGDYRTCPIEKWGPFDIVWDRASFIALDYNHGSRESYVDIMKRSVGVNSPKDHEFRYLLQTVQYDKSVFDGPPKCVTDEDILNHFNAWSSITLLEKKFMPDDHPCRTVTPSMPREAYESFNLLTNKAC